jgi:hypothetical protein
MARPQTLAQLEDKASRMRDSQSVVSNSNSFLLTNSEESICPDLPQLKKKKTLTE